MTWLERYKVTTGVTGTVVHTLNSITNVCEDHLMHANKTPFNRLFTEGIRIVSRVIILYFFIVK